MYKCCKTVLNWKDHITILKKKINPLNAELNPICHLLALLGDQHILHVSRVRVNFPLHAMKEYGVMSVYHHTFLTQY